MWTSVYKTILDHSITGEKIFDGSINWVDAIYADALYVNHSGAGGLGSIDGSTFKIGYNVPINHVQSKNVFVDGGVLGTGSFVATSSSIQKVIIGLISHKAQFYLKTTAGVLSIKLNPDDTFNYIKTKMIIGGTAETKSPSFLLEVIGKAYATEFSTTSVAIRASDIITPDVFFNFLSPAPIYASAWYTQYLLYKAKIDAYASNLNLITSTFITNVLANLSGISINNVGWQYLEAINQPLSLSDSPVFTNISSDNYNLESVGADLDAAEGEITSLDSAVGDLQSDVTALKGLEWETHTEGMIGAGVTINASTVSMATKTSPWTDMHADDIILVSRRRGSSGWSTAHSLSLILTGVAISATQIRFGITNPLSGTNYPVNQIDMVNVKLIRTLTP